MPVQVSIRKDNPAGNGFRLYFNPAGQYGLKDFKLKPSLFWLFQKHLYICDFIKCKVIF